MHRTARRHIRQLAWAVGALSCAAAGCSLLVTADGVQCSVDADCASKGGAFAGKVCRTNLCVDPARSTDARWDCLGQVPAFAADASIGITAFTVVDFATRAPLGDVHVVGCATLDVGCVNPITPAVTSSAEGMALLQFPQGSTGFVRATWDGGPPTVYVPDPPPGDLLPEMDAGVPRVPVLMLQSAVLAQLYSIYASQFGGPGPLDPTRATMVFAAIDCAGAPAAGVSLSIENLGPSAVGPLYIKDGVPADSKETDSSGIAGAAYVAAGGHNVTATLRATGQRIGAVGATARPGEVTIVVAGPTP